MAQPVLWTLAAAAASVVAAASAQEMPSPAYEPSGFGGPMIAPEPVPAPMADGFVGDMPALSPIPMTPHDAIPLDGCYPAITESTGTWLRRGLWYADVDAVVMARTWDSNGALLVEEYDGVQNQTIIQAGAIPFTNTVRVQAAGLGESSPGYDGSARLALGRFLFRDQANRDHTAEMVVFGGAEWDERVGVEAQLTEANGLNPANAGSQSGLHVPFAIDRSSPLDLDIIRGFPSFDRAQTMDIRYASRFHSWEWNYNMAQRMRKDRMELQPSGEWVRKASPGFTWDYTAGLRYFDVEEGLSWLATDINSIDNTVGQTAGDTSGSYQIGTSNNLFGLQLGAGMTYESDRWNLTVSTKQGAYINDGRATTALSFDDPDGVAAIALNNYTTDLHENGVSYLGSGSILARYHLRPNVSLRAGWEFMYVTGLALAPNQADFNPANRQLNLTGDAFYHGVSFGSEFYW